MGKEMLNTRFVIFLEPLESLITPTQPVIAMISTNDENRRGFTESGEA